VVLWFGWLAHVFTGYGVLHSLGNGIAIVRSLYSDGEIGPLAG
jgi:hypothetical protein